MLFLGAVSVDAVSTVAAQLMLSNASTLQGKHIFAEELLDSALRGRATRAFWRSPRGSRCRGFEQEAGSLGQGSLPHSLGGLQLHGVG